MAGAAFCFLGTERGHIVPQRARSTLIRKRLTSKPAPQGLITRPQSLITHPYTDVAFRVPVVALRTPDAEGVNSFG